MSAGSSARSVRQVDGLDPVRALQRVLYRSAKQDGTRRFHALFDKLARSDVMWRAWVDVEEPSPSRKGEGHGRHRWSWSRCLGTSRRRGRGMVTRLSSELERSSSAPPCGGG